ncbi:MAG: VWA domain-containing protein [Acidobacteriota bacterium]
MKRVLAGVVLLVLAGVALAERPRAQEVFRAATDMVLLSVSATDGQGHAVPSLTKSDFGIFEDGVPQDVSLFARDPQPLALSILIDASTSMETKMGTATEAAIGFCRRLGPNDVAQIIAFSSTTEILQTFTHDQALLEGAIRQTHANGSTALYTAVYIALNELNRVRASSPESIRRQAIIVLSDGEDTTSLLRDEDVLDLSKRSAVTVYAIGLREKRDKDAPPNRNGSQADYVLRSLSQSSGGRVFFVDDPVQLSTIYGQIADELASQYIVGYSSKNQRRDGAWRQIAVRVARPGVTARTRAGYYGPTKAQ